MNVPTFLFHQVDPEGLLLLIDGVPLVGSIHDPQQVLPLPKPSMPKQFKKRKKGS